MRRMMETMPQYSTLRHPGARMRAVFGRCWLLGPGLAMILALLPVGLAQANAEIGYIARMVGSIEIDGTWAKQGDSFGSGATLASGDKSYALLKFADGQRVFLKANTTLIVDEYVYDKQADDRNKSSLSLLKGGIRAVSGLIAKHNREAVRYNTPTITMGVRGTEFMLSMANGRLFVHVLSGAISLMPPVDGMDAVMAGDYLALSDLGDVIATGAEARAAAEAAGAFKQMNAIPMDASSAAETPFKWKNGRAAVSSAVSTRVRKRLRALARANQDGLNLRVINRILKNVTENFGQLEALDIIDVEEPSKGRGDFERIDLDD